jgi:hypothetical protein
MSAEGHFRLVAETASWPLWAEGAFASRLCRLTRDQHGILDSSTQAMAGDLESYLRPRSRGVSLELLRQIGHRTWFSRRARQRGRLKQEIPLHRYLIDLAIDYLRVDGGGVRLRSDSAISPAVAAARWRWLSLALPQDLLVAARCAGDGVPPPGESISAASPVIDRFLLENRIAQTHLHHGAATPFPVLWTNLMTRIGGDLPTAKALDKNGPCPFGGGGQLLRWLVATAIVRLALANFLARRAGQATQFGDHLSMRRARGLDERVRAALIALKRGSSPPPAAESRYIYRQLASGHMALPETLDDVRREDPIRRWFRQPACLAETEFLAAGLRYLSQGARDPDFEILFWQYVRVRGRLFRHVTEEPGTNGLDWFIRHFDRISALRCGITSRLRVASALEIESRSAWLGSLEVRTAPDSRWTNVRNEIRDVAVAEAPRRIARDRSPERGLVLHFIKQGERRIGGKTIRNGDPRQVAYGCRFGAYYYDRWKETLAIARAMRLRPRLLAVLRALDICNSELSVPNWVFFPLLTSLRRLSSQICARHQGDDRIAPLRLTLHAGEEYRHVLEGLRRMHEPLEFGVMLPGDRVGHGLALGADVQHWARESGYTTMPLEDRLDDLLWELARYQAGDIAGEGARIEQVRALVNDYGRRMYGARPTPPAVEELLAARSLRHLPSALQRIGYPFLTGALAATAPGPWQLLRSYLCDPAVFERGQQPIEVALDGSEVNAVQSAQRHLRVRFSHLQITVEANPSSNLLVGGTSLDEHPIFRLQPLAPRAGAESAVAVALGDDDPLTFASSLPEEFANVYFALTRNGVDAPAAIGWLSQVAGNAWNARFTLPVTRDPDELRRYLDL